MLALEVSYLFRLQEGDLVVLCTDGVHDNLDPEFMGVAPNSCGLSATSWNSGEHFIFSQIR